jgi:hypothetical protein
MTRRSRSEGSTVERRGIRKESAMRRWLEGGVMALTVLAALMGGSAVIGGQGPARARDAVVPADARVLPVASIGEDALRRLASISGRWAQVPVAVEVVAKPMSEADTRAWAVGGDPEAGRTVAALLDELVVRDGRYGWRDVGGVAVVRPVDAWNDESHLLHRRIGRVELNGVTMAEAVEAIYRLFGEPVGRGGGEVPVSTEPGLDEATKADAKERRASLILENPTVLEVLNSYVLAHGAATWRLSWCGEMRDVEHAQLELMTFFGEAAAVAGKGCRP